MIAMRIQEQAFGGLDRDSLTFLDGLARRGVSPRRHLKPGTVLVREYQGERHTVTVGRDGFEWQGSDLSEPVGDRARHHRHGLERPALLRAADNRRSRTTG